MDTPRADACRASVARPPSGEQDGRTEGAPGLAPACAIHQRGLSRPQATGIRSLRILDRGDRARWGASGALYLQSALAGLNARPRPGWSGAPRARDVEGR